MEILRIDNVTETAHARQRITEKTRAALLAEQAALVERLSEITAILSGKVPAKPAAHIPQRWPDGFNIQAYAIGIIWKKPDIEVTELARLLGVSRSTIYSPQWADVARMLAARKNTMPRPSHTDPEIDDELD